MKRTLTADLGYDIDHGDVVNVSFGTTTILTLAPARPLSTGWDPDRDAERQAIVEDTVAPILQRLFALVADDLNATAMGTASR